MIRLSCILTISVLLSISAPCTGYSGTTILFLGDSLTSGLGVAPEQAFPSLVARKLETQGFGPVKSINGGLSGSTTASGLSRLKWYMKARPDLLFLALGANDGLRGLSVDRMYDHLDAILTYAREQRMEVILAGMEVPPNYGASYAAQFRDVYRKLADKHSAVFIPFLLEGVGGVARLNQADGIHPNPDGHRAIAELVFPVVADTMKTHAAKSTGQAADSY